MTALLAVMPNFRCLGYTCSHGVENANASRKQREMRSRAQKRVDPQRKVQSHKKSRNGCSTCKLRCVKCDERKPQCRKCQDYGSVCSYGQADLQARVEKVIQIVQLPYWPNKVDGLLDKFRALTAPTVSAGPILYLYQNDMLRIAHTHPHLKHALLAISSMHTRRLDGFPEHQLSTFEAQQWYRAAQQLRIRLSTPARDPETKASLVMASSLLFQITFCHVEAEAVGEAWPLCEPSASDLSWLKLTGGKKEILKQSQPLLHDHTYKHLLLGPDPSLLTPLTYERELPQELARLWNLHVRTDANPYFTAAVTLTNGLYSADVVGMLLHFLRFISNVDAGFGQLLEVKDPRALLLLACWFSLVARLPVWWLQRRAEVEGQAIRQYLLQYHKTMDPDQLIHLGTHSSPQMTVCH